MALVASAIAGPWLLASRPWIGPDPQQSLVAVVRHLGPFALLAPAGWLLARRLRGLNQIVLVAIVVAALAAFIPGSGRWWSLLVAPLCIASVWSWRELARLPRLAFAAAHAGLAVLAAALLTGCFDIASDAGAVALGLESRDEYLRQHVPIYPAASLVNQMLAPGQSVYCQDSRTFYFACPTVLASRQRGDSFPAGDAPDERLLATRAKRAGCSYLLLSENVDSASVEPVRAAASDNPTADMPDTAMGAEANVEVIPIREYRIADDNNRYIRYKLLRIR